MAFNLNLLGIAFQLHIISFFFGGLSKCENYALHTGIHTNVCVAGFPCRVSQISTRSFASCYLYAHRRIYSSHIKWVEFES